MQGNFEKCLSITLSWEGGYVNHPRDPGGETNMGITRHTYESWLGRSVTTEEMKNLTYKDVAPIYRRNYWDVCRCDDIPLGIDLQVFDLAVNAGTRRAARYLQELIPGCSVDGAIGPITISMLHDHVVKNGPKIVIQSYMYRRQKFYESLKTWPTFGRGWTNRNNEVYLESLKMINK